jgi:hypothetical protein
MDKIDQTPADQWLEEFANRLLVSIETMDGVASASHIQLPSLDHPVIGVELDGGHELFIDLIAS